MADARPGGPINSKLLLAVYLPTLLLALCNGLLVPTLPVFASALEVSYGLVGLILAGDSIGMLLADVPAGALLRRIGMKRAMLLGLTLAGLSVLGLAFTDSALLVVLLRVTAGAGASLFNISRHVYLTEELPVARRGRAIALFGGTNRFGEFIGPLAGGFIAAGFGLGATFMVYAGLALLTLILCLRFVERQVIAPRDPSAGRMEAVKLLADTVRSQSGVLIPAGLGQLGAQAIRTGRRVLIPLFAADVLGLSVEQVGVIVSFAALADFLLFYPAGIIMDRYGRKFAIVPSFLVQALSLLLLPFTGGFSSLLIVAAIGGLGNGIGSGTMLTLGSDLAPKERTGEFLGVWRLIGDVGAATGPLLVGGFAQLLGLGPSAGAIAAMGAAGSLLFAYRVRETLVKPGSYRS